MLRGALVAIAVLVGAAHADPLADAKTQVAASDYLNARTSLDTAFTSGTNSPEQLAEIWRLRGIVAGALNDAKAATDAFQRCLVLDPKSELPPGTSPKITRPFQAARDKKHEPLKIKQTTTETPPAVTVAIASDPMKMIANILVFVRVAGAAEEKLDKKFAGQEAIEFSLPAGGRLDLRIAAVDEKGNHLAELGSADVPIVIVGKQVEVKKPDVIVEKPKPQQPVHARPLYLKWWMWGGGAVVFAGLGLGFGIDGLVAKNDLEDLNAESPNHRFPEAKSLENRARRDFLIANISYGLAGALAIGATILYLTEPRAPKQETRLTAIPVDGGGAIVLGGHF
jgi:hypothetical protein